LAPARLGRENPLGWRQEFGMRRLVYKFLADESGATAIEYCLIAVGLSIVIITAVRGIGTTLNINYASVNNSLK
jgi:pilus assembly protein Flp/PilA